MDKEDIIKQLAELRDKNRSDSSKLREIFDDVEAAMAAGVKRTAILETLNSSGFTLTLRGFDQMMYRFRQKNKNPAIKVAPKTVTENKAPATSPTKGAPGVFIHNSNANPEDLF